MSGEFTIRPYRPSDEQRVWVVHERAFRESPMEFVEDAPGDDIIDVAEQCLDGDGRFFVGIVGGDIVATGGYQQRASDTAEIRRMRVHPAHQGQGFGEQLLEEIERRVYEAGNRSIVLHTNERLRAARTMYRKHGYEETHRETLAGLGDELIYYRKQLPTDGDPTQ